jgi:hypothetical protein
MNILVTNFEDSGEDVMIFTENPKYSVDMVEKTLKEKGEAFEEVYEVEDKDLQYYCYDACFIK